MIPNAKALDLQHQRLWLLAEKAIYWEKHKALLIADLHIGKSGHFRKNGIAVPKEVNRSNLENLSSVIEKTSAEHLVILGDLFHSEINKEWRQFIEWRKQYSELEVSLAIGNHDILEKEHYDSGVINLFKKVTMGPFLMVHDLNEFNMPDKNDRYLLSGHIHPAVKLKGKGRQGLKLPCFYFNKNYGILPAFGGFTGTHVIEPQESNKVFVIADSNVLSTNDLA